MQFSEMFAPPESLVISETSTTGSSKSDPLETEASDIVAGGGAKADAFVSPAIPINLEETAEDAWMRRARLSGKTNVASVQRFGLFFFRNQTPLSSYNGPGEANG
jgi:hypothetical protein